MRGGGRAGGGGGCLPKFALVIATVGHSGKGKSLNSSEGMGVFPGTQQACNGSDMS